MATIYLLGIARVAVSGIAIVTVTGAIAQNRPADRARPGGVGVQEKNAGAAGAINPSQKARTTDDQDADSRFGGTGADVPELQRTPPSGDSASTLTAPPRYRPEADCRRRHRPEDRFKPTKGTAESQCDSRPQQ